MPDAPDLQALSEKLLNTAKQAGADAADTIFVAGDSISIEVLEGKLEHAERAEGIDVGLRVLIGQKQANIASSDIRETTFKTMAERAVAMAKVAPDDPYCGLADPDQLATDWDIEALDLNDDTQSPEPKALQDMALEAEAAAQAVEGVSKVQASGSGWSGNDVWLAGTNGFSAGYRRTSWSTSCVAITGEGLGMERDYYGDGRTHFADLISPTEIGRIAGERTAERNGATRPPTGTYPILIDERVSSSIIGHLTSAINGASIARGSSWLKDALGKRILPEHLSLIEDPHRPRTSGSRPFDAEGLPKDQRAIIQDGVLTGWTLDLATARKLGMESTGNAARGTTAPPAPSIGNLALTQGDKTREELLKDMGTGLWITSFIGSTISPTTGDYSRGASGFWVENGEVTGPVNECTVAGNLRDMLQRIIPANDARTHLSRVVPSLLIEDMTIAGS